MKALILCGGKGERLKPLTESLPKPLVPINGKPILSYILAHLKSYNINDIIVATGYKSEKIESYLSSSEYTDQYNIKIVNSGDVDIIQRIRDSLSYINEDFILVYGDTLSNVNIKNLIKFHQSEKSKVTVTLWPMRSPFGILELDENNYVDSYQEKPVLDKWINIGYFYYSKEMKNSFEQFASYEEYLHTLVDNKNLKGFKHTGIHITVNTQKELSEAEDQIHQLMSELDK